MTFREGLFHVLIVICFYLSVKFEEYKFTQYNEFASAYSRRLARTSSSISKAAKFAVWISAYLKNSDCIALTNVN